MSDYLDDPDDDAQGRSGQESVGVQGEQVSRKLIVAAIFIVTFYDHDGSRLQCQNNECNEYIPHLIFIMIKMGASKNFKGGGFQRNDPLP